MTDQADATTARIRRLAYTFWELEGRPEGRGDVHWHRAQAEVEAAGQTGGEDGEAAPEDRDGAAPAPVVKALRRRTAIEPWDGF
jgi:hypothetical protein